MHPVITILATLAGGVLAFWLLPFAYGLIRKDTPEDKRPGRKKTRMLDGLDDGGGGGAD